jgi:hypothetical protein
LPQVEVAMETVEDQALAIFQDKQQMVVIKGVEENFSELTHISEILYGDGNFELEAADLQYGTPGLRLAATLGTGARWDGFLHVFAPKRAGQLDMGNPEDGFVCWDSVGAAEMGDSGNASSAFYVYDEGLSAFQAGNANEVALRGGVSWTTWDADGRWFGYGNFSTGHVRAFVYNGQKYVIACSGSWPCNWITIQKANNLTEDDAATEDVDESKQNYLLETDIIEGAAQCYPCCAYVYDPATGTGHVIYLSQSSAAVAYDIKTNRI